MSLQLIIAANPKYAKNIFSIRNEIKNYAMIRLKTRLKTNIRVKKNRKYLTKRLKKYKYKYNSFIYLISFSFYPIYKYIFLSY